MRLFHLVRKADGSFIVGGVIFEDGFVVARWNATQNLPIGKHGLSQYDSVEWFLAVHGREGDAVMKYLDEEEQ
jgi:hypothetical protein